LSERNSVAGTTMTLISMFRSEINSVNISPIKVSWELSLWNITSSRIFFEFLSFSPSSLEILLLSKSRNFGLFVSLRGGLSKGKGCLFLAMWSVICMMLLEFASIGFPSKIKVVNCLNHKIVLVRRYVSMMSVESFVRFSFELLSFRSDSWANHKVGIISWSVSSSWSFSSFSGCCFGSLSFSLNIFSVWFNWINILIFCCLSCTNFWSINLGNLSLSNFLFTAWQSFISFCLFSKEALTFMVFHCASISTWLLNETNHGLLADGIETCVITCSKSLCEMIISLSYSINTKITFNIISKIGNESSSIF